MRIAVAVFNKVVSPRVDIANEIFIYRFRKGQLINKEILSIDGEDPFHFYSVIKEREVDKIVLGSCPEHILNLLISTGVEIYTNAMGNPDKIALQYSNGKYGKSHVSDKSRRLNNKENLT